MLDADVEVDRRDFAVRAAVSVPPGERLALFGPSGAGKTTILEAIAGLVPLRRGRVVLRGRVLSSTGPPAVAVPPWRRGVGLLRQDPGLFPHLSVRGNLGYAPAADAAGRGDRARRLDELAGRLGLGGLLQAMPARLSGGQAHRVALGRLLLADCDALLLDEPYSGLDAALRRSLTELVIGLVGDREVPSVLVAHELPDAQAFASRLAVLDRGSVLQTGTPHEVVLRPASRRVAELVGYLGFVPVRASAAAVGAEVGAGEAVAGEAVAGVHPDRVVAGAHPGRGVVVTGTLTRCVPAGAGWEVGLGLGEATVVCRLADRPQVRDGRLVVTALDPPCFGPDGVAVPKHGGGDMKTIQGVTPAW
ncbi:MAG TPA: ATP-binding cassette domain-containing protein [Streptosporangiaceae bacterium]|nr:ATP-binding cassette domain-containing protein [Streptosporangiaceae bacterium]